MTVCEFLANDHIRPVVNRHGIETMLNFRPFIIRNVCVAGGYSFTADEVLELKKLLDYCHETYLNNDILGFLIDDKVRKIFNWRGLESVVGMNKQRIYTTAVAKYPLLSNEQTLLNEYFTKFFVLSNQILILPQ